MMYIDDEIGFALEVCTPDGKVLYTHDQALSIDSVKAFEELVRGCKFVCCDGDKYTYKESEINVSGGEDYSELFDVDEDEDYPEILVYSIIVIGDKNG